MKKQWVIFVIRILLSCSILVFIFWKINIHQTFSLFSKINIVMYALALGISSINISALAALRWRVLLDERFTMPFPLMTVWAFVARSMNNLIPGGVVGDVMRMWGGAKYHSEKNVYVSSVVTDRCIALIGMALMSIGGVLLKWQELHDAGLRVYWILAVTIAITGVFLLYSGVLKNTIFIIRKISTRLYNRIEKIIDALSMYRYKRKGLGLSLLISLFSVCCVVSVFYLLGRSIQIEISWITWLAFAPMITIISMIPVTIGGVGIRDYCMIIFLGTADIKETEAVAISTLYFSIMTVQFIFSSIGIWIVTRSKSYASLQETQV